jgi:GNAT superfamily N-acetyltransferase
LRREEELKRIAMTFEIRHARLADAGTLAGLMGQLGYPTTPQDMTLRLEAILARPDHYTTVAVVEGCVVGLAGSWWGPFFEKNGRYGRVIVMVVDEHHRGRGIGTALLRDAEQWLASAGAPWVVITSANRREQAHAFYERHGYRATGKRFVRDLTEDPPACSKSS